MADLDRFSMFTEARERLGRSLVRGVSDALPECADALDRAAVGASAAAVRGARAAAASALLGERDARASRALARLYDLTFRLLELNQSAADDEGEPPLLALLGDEELDHQILVDTLAGVVRERLGDVYERAQRRVDALTRAAMPADDGRAPLGAGVLSAAALEAFRPFTSSPPTRGTLREALLRGLAPRLADAIAELDAWLASRGVEPTGPPVPAPVPTPVPTPVPAPLPAPVAAIEPAREASARRAPPQPHEAVRAAAASPDRREGGVRGAGVGPGPGSVAVPPAMPFPSAASDAAAARPEPGPAPASVSEPPATGANDAAASAAVARPEPVPAPPPAPAPEADAGAHEAPMERAAEALLHATQVADVLGRQPFAVGRPESSYRHAGTLPRPEALERDGVAFAHQVGVSPYTRAARQRFFEGLRGRMLAAQAPAAQLAALDLVAALFDYVVDDARMPAAAQPLLWRLQQPVAMLAALDAGFLGDDRRSIRRLVENLTAISVAYADDVVPGSELYRRLDTVVRAVEVVSHAFQARSSVLGEQVRREYDRAAQGVAQLVSRVAKERLALEATPGRRNRRDYSRRPSREREQAVTRRLEAELRGRLERCEVPESVRDFLLGVWLRHLRTALLRDGEESAQFRLSIQVVDDLLWSLDASGPRQSRRELAGRIPPLIRLLTQGVSDIGARAEEFRPFLDELFLIHLRKMQRVPNEDDAEASAPPRADDDATARVEARPGVPPAAAGDDRDAPLLEDRWLEPPAQGGGPDPVAGPSTRPLPLRPEERGRAGPGAEACSPSRGPMAAAGDGDGDGAVGAPIAPGATHAGASRAPEAPGPGADRPDATDPPAPDDEIVRAGPARRPILPPDDARSGDQRLLSVLSSLDLGDFPDAPQRLRMEPDVALERLGRGDWLELIGRDGLPQEVKVAWINSRRTVVLLVRRPDRRALSLRVAELRQRFAEHKASLIV